MKRLKKETKDKLGVLWVLLNSSTEYKYPSSKICDVMDAISERVPEAVKTWDKTIEIKVNEKTIFTWNMGKEGSGRGELK